MKRVSARQPWPALPKRDTGDRESMAKNTRIPQAGENIHRPSARRAMLVLGPHRSGTSAITRLLNECGATLSTSLVAPAADNVTGFWEPAEIVALHEQILGEVKSSWEDPTKFPATWFDSASAQRFRQMILAVLQRDFAEAPLFVIKDPRLCRLMPLWLNVLQDFNAEPAFVLAVRNPLEVAASLRVRNGLSTGAGTMLWLRYSLEAEFNSRGRPRATVDYAELMRDWRPAIASIGAKCDLVWPALSATTRAEIDKFLRNDLRHHSYTAAALQQDPDVSDWVKEAYTILSGPEIEAVEARTALDRIRQQLDQADVSFAPLLAEHDIRTEDFRQEVLRYKEALQDREAKIAETAGMREDLLHQTQTLSAELQSRQAELAALQGAVEQYQVQIKQAVQVTQDKDREIGELRRHADNLTANGRQLEEQLNQAKQVIEARERESGELRRHADNLSNNLAERDRALAGLQASLSASEKLLPIRQAEIEALTLSSQQLQRQLDQVNNQTRLLTSELEEQRNRAALLGQTVAQRDQMIANLRDVVANGEAVLASRTADTAQLTAALNQLQARFDNVNAILAERDRAVSELRRHQAILEDTVIERDRSAAELNAALAREQQRRVSTEHALAESRQQIMEYSRKTAELAALEAKVAELNLGRDKLLQEMQAGLRAKDEQIAQLAANLEETRRRLDQDSMLLKTVLDNANERAETVSRFIKLADQREKDLADLHQTLSERNTLVSQLAQQRDALQIQVNEAIKRQARIEAALPQLQASDSARDAEIKKLHSELDQMRGSLSWRLTRALRATGRLMRRNRLALEAKLASDMATITGAGLFDADFYLQNYPDVRSTGIDPLYHFVSSGVFEGRRPLPGFDPAEHFARHPEFKHQRVNPLVHLILSLGAEQARALLLHPPMIARGNVAPEVQLEPPIAIQLLPAPEQPTPEQPTPEQPAREQPGQEIVEASPVPAPPAVSETAEAAAELSVDALALAVLEDETADSDDVPDEEIPRDVALPSHYRGCLEQPAPNTTVSNLVLVQGWLININEEIRSISIHVNNIIVSAKAMDRPDVAAAFPNVTGAERAGFTSYVDISWLPVGPGQVAVAAVLADGRKEFCFSCDINIIHEARPLEVFEPLKAESSSAVPSPKAVGNIATRAWRALRNGNLPMSPSLWLREIRKELNIREALPAASHWQQQTSYERWLQANQLTPALRERMAADAARIKDSGPLISVLVPLYNTPQNFLVELIESMTAQIYPNWELCLADDASPQPHVRRLVKRYQRKDPRIKAVFRKENGHISAATNSALEIATGSFCALLDHDDLLTPDALLHVAENVLAHPDVEWIYTDEDKIDETGRRYDPQFKAGWSPEMAITHNYTHHLSVFRTDILRSLNGLRSAFNGAQDLDLFLRAAEVVPTARVRHVPHICYHWRAHSNSTATRGDQKAYIFDSAKRGIEEALQRRALAAAPVLPPVAERYNMCLYQLSWSRDLLRQNPVTIVIPTRDRVDLLRKCVISLQKTLPPESVQLIIVDDKSADPETLRYFEKLVAQRIFSCKVIQNTHPDRGFNYSRLVNLAYDHIETELLLHLNNDVVATKAGWLEDMVGWMSVPGVGAVGARLMQPDGTHQHGGIGVHGPQGLPFEYFSGLRADEVGYLALTQAARNVASVTGACLLTSKTLYKAVGGFDEENFGVEFNDVDYCLKLQNHGERIVYSPNASLVHLGSASRSGIPYNPLEHLNFITKYRDFDDIYANKNLRVVGGHLDVDPMHFNHADRIGHLKVLFISHELKIGGAPIVLSEYAKYFLQEAKFEVEFASPSDGPLFDRLHDAGIKVHIIGRDFLSPQLTSSQLEAELRKIGQRLDLTAYDLIVCNTITTYWGIEMARLFQRPVIWHIHESLRPEEYEQGLAPDHAPLFKRAFDYATRVVFQSQSTEQLYRNYNLHGNFRRIPGGLPIQKINEFRRQNSRASLREKYNIPEDRIVVTLIATTSERKGHHVFVDAIAKMQKQMGDRLDNVSFIMVGARPELAAYVEFLNDKIKAQNVRNTVIVDETEDIYDYFGLSDIFVCASYNESFPMVVLLAMAFELRILSTNVFGIVELISDGHEGALIPPGNSDAMSKSLMTIIEHEAAYKRLAVCARVKVARLFDNSQLLPQHVRLAKEAAMAAISKAD